MDIIKTSEQQKEGIFQVRLSGKKSPAIHLCRYVPTVDGTTKLSRVSREDVDVSEINTELTLVLSSLIYKQVIVNGRNAIRKMNQYLGYFVLTPELMEWDDLKKEGKTPTEFISTSIEENATDADKVLHEVQLIESGEPNGKTAQPQMQTNTPAYFKSLSLNELMAKKRSCSYIIEMIDETITEVLKS